MIKVIFFDGAGTLFHLRESVGAHYAAVAREQGAELCPDALDRAFLRAWREAPIRAASGRPRDDDDRGWWRDLVELVLARIPKLPPSFDRQRFFEAAYAHFARPGVWSLYPDVKEVLTHLQRQYELSVISNFDSRLHAILDNLGIAHFFRHVFISSRLGVDKPNPEIYRHAVVLSGVRPEESMHVGDDPERDWAGAVAAGLEIFRLDRARNSLRDLHAQLAGNAPVLRAARSSTKSSGA